MRKLKSLRNIPYNWYNGYQEVRVTVCYYFSPQKHINGNDRFDYSNMLFIYMMFLWKSLKMTST